MAISQYKLIISNLSKIKILLLAFVLVIIIVESFFSPIKRFLLYETLNTFVESGNEISETEYRPGPGRILLTPPPKANPPIFKLDQKNTSRCYTIILKNKDGPNVPGNPKMPIEICADLNEKGALENVKVCSKSENKKGDDYILGCVKNWRFTPYAEGPIKLIIKVRAGLAIIDLSDRNLKVSADRIAKGPNLGRFQKGVFRSGIKVKTGRNEFY